MEELTIDPFHSLPNPFSTFSAISEILQKCQNFKLLRWRWLHITKSSEAPYKSEEEAMNSFIKVVLSSPNGSAILIDEEDLLQEIKEWCQANVSLQEREKVEKTLLLE